MGGKNSKPTEGSSTPPVSGAPADTTQAAARRSATDAPTPAAAPKDTLSTASIVQGTLSGRPIHYDALAIISDFNPAIAGLNRNAAASAKRAGVEQKRNETITKKLLTAVANGMESASVNINPLPGNLFAEDLLKKSPEFLLERAHFKDWGGRNFEGRKTVAHPKGEGITAFEYALWARDFKMLEMMIGCIPAGAEGDEIRACLLAQYEQVTAPVCAALP